MTATERSTFSTPRRMLGTKSHCSKLAELRRWVASSSATVDIVEDRGGEPAPCKPPEVMEVVALAEAHYEIAVDPQPQRGRVALYAACGRGAAALFTGRPSEW